MTDKQPEFDSITKITLPKDFDSRGAAAIIAEFVQRLAQERSWPLKEFIDDVIEATTKAGQTDHTHEITKHGLIQEHAGDFMKRMNDPGVNAAQEYITYATAWIDALPNGDDGERRWSDEKIFRNAASVSADDREDLLERMRARKFPGLHIVQ
jgi:hypothetical protein